MAQRKSTAVPPTRLGGGERLRLGDRSEERIDVGPRRAEPDARADGTRNRHVLTTFGLVEQPCRVGVVDAKQVGDEGMGAERSGAHGDPAVGQMRPELMRLPALSRERGDADSIGRIGPLVEPRDAADRVEPVPEDAREEPFLLSYGVHAVGRERIAGSTEGDGTEEVRRAGLVPSRRLGPGDAVERDDPDGAAAVEQRRPVGEPVRLARRARRCRTARRPCAPRTRGSRPRARGGRSGGAVRAARHRRRRVRPARVREAGDLGDRRHLAGDVRGAGDRDERERIAGALGLLERLRRCGEERGGGRRERKMRHAVLTPGQEVRVVLERRAQHPGPGRQGNGEQIRRFRRVADEDHVVRVVAADEAGHGKLRDSSNSVVE